jgi:hypothetical protein
MPLGTIVTGATAASGRTLVGVGGCDPMDGGSTPDATIRAANTANSVAAANNLNASGFTVRSS